VIDAVSAFADYDNHMANDTLVTFFSQSSVSPDGKGEAREGALSLDVCGCGCISTTRVHAKTLLEATDLKYCLHEGRCGEI
jgi:hypothetical protein